MILSVITSGLRKSQNVCLFDREKLSVKMHFRNAVSRSVLVSAVVLVSEHGSKSSVLPTVSGPDQQAALRDLLPLPAEDHGSRVL